MTDKQRSLTIRYVNGDEETFEFPALGEDDPANLALHFQKHLDADQLVIELKDRILIIPKRNILNFEISPKPSKLPQLTIKNATMVLESRLLK